MNGNREHSHAAPPVGGESNTRNEAGTEHAENVRMRRIAQAQVELLRLLAKAVVARLARSSLGERTPSD